jgi:DNA-directed RNA polymerase specialized sigma24 family protein
MLNYAGLQQAIDDRGGRYCITGTIRPGEFDYRYADTSDEAERISDKFADDRRYQVRIHPPTVDMDVATELAKLGAQRKDLRAAEREATAKLRAMVLRAASRGFAEADIARRADVDRMTVRKWLGTE